MTPRIPYRFERDRDAASLHAEFGSLADGANTGLTVTVAGRLMLVRDQGKVCFATLQDGSGTRIQLFAGADWTEDFEGLAKRNLGDWVGATGEVIKTKRGELSVRVAKWTMLAPTRRPFPDKWHGLTDPDTRYRQRYVDLWVGETTRRSMMIRSRTMSLIRRWLDDRGYIEVETPNLQAIPGGAEARPFVTHHNALDRELYLRIAHELYLKRLVVGGFEKVYELGRVFRNEGISPWHQPEYTMLELYEAYADYGDIARLLEELVSHLALEICGTTKLTYKGRVLDLTPPWKRVAMLDLIEEHAGVRLDVRMPVEELRSTAQRLGVRTEDAWGAGKLVVEIFEKTTEPNLWGPVLVLDHPAEVSPLARDHREIPGLVERFEPIVAGKEIGNAFSELTDPDIQRERFEQQVARRAGGDEEAHLYDADYVRALEYGLPPTGGLGLGIDRLVMILSGEENIRDVTLFPTLRADPTDS